MRQFTHTSSIAAPPSAVLDAFFDAGALAAWWHVTRSACTPQPFGGYVLEWPSTAWEDETLGRLGGQFRGTVIDFRDSREFFVAEAFWVPPDGSPLGPMAFEATCTPLGASTRLQVRQSGFANTRRWTRYYDLLDISLPAALEELKVYLERRAG